MTVESAIVVIIPEAEKIIGEHRRLLDASASRGVPAHVTLLYPFLPPDQIDFDVLRKLDAVTEAQPAFDVSFTRTQWFGDDVLWLQPSPESAFRQLTDALYSRFPETPPYGGEIVDPVPHLTIGASGDIPAMRSAESAVGSHLPFTAAIGSISVIAWSADADSWQSVAEFALRGR
jgi:2'-5' RNA ligase